MSEVWTSLKLIQWTTAYFKKAGVPDPRLDAELLLTHLLKCQRIDLYTQHDKRIREKDLAQFKGLVQRRVRREPLQYITGETEFYGLVFKVTPDVLIPRPETELLVEEAVKAWQGHLSPVSSAEPAVASPRAGSAPPALSARPKPEATEGRACESFRRETSDKHPCQALEIGTGSGCIAITLAKLLPEARIAATDISRDALEIASQNAKRHDVDQRIEFLLADIAPWRVFQLEGRMFNLILSNPPYVPTEEFPSLQPEVRDFEPRPALDGGPHGLVVIQKLVTETSPFLTPGGHLLVEIGEGQAAEAIELARRCGFSHVHIKRDLRGVERILVAQKS